MFEPGQVVRLKSGGPLMTIKEVDALTHHLICHWFEDATLHTKTFKADQISITKFHKSKELFGLDIDRGGWYSGNWYSQKEIDDIKKALFKQNEETALREEPEGDGYRHIYAQCGGCKHFAAYDSDYGICIEEQSPNFGRVTFEHSGCSFHSWWKDHNYFE